MNDRLLGMLGMAVRAGKVSFGVFMTEKALNDGKACLVVTAEDMGASNRRKIEAKCKEWDTDIIFYSDKESLSKAIGRKDTPVVAVCDEGFSKAIVKIYGGVQK